jgi:anti-sigma B factor antagonist
VDFSGRIGLGGGSALLRQIMDELLGEGRIKIILNLSEVESIDSSGIGELIHAYYSANTKDGRLTLLNPAKSLWEVLQLTQLSRVFEVYVDEGKALESFG